MADSCPSYTTRPFPRANSMYSSNNGSNNYTRFVGKCLFFTFFLIAIPLFPSQAPDFINQTILQKFWELVHLMFIGIAVSYGLFGRRYVVDNGNHDDSQSYVSGMFHVSSFSEDNFDHPMYCSGLGKAGIFNVNNGTFENPYEENLVQALSCKYYQGEPLVVLARPNCGLGKYGECESASVKGHKPLGLPIRSLKSRVASQNRSSESSGLSVKDSSDGSKKGRIRKFSDFVSENLEGKFSESDVLGTPILWRSRSERMRERVHGGGQSRPSHFRPLSVDETQFESLKSWSLQFTASFSPQSRSFSPSSLSPSHSHSSFSESTKPKLSELAWQRSPNLCFSPTFPSIRKASVIASHSRHYSDASLLGTNARKCFEEELNQFCDSKMDDPSSNREWISGSLKFDAKPKPIASFKASPRGKFVRTFRSFRAQGARGAGEKQQNQPMGKLAMVSDEIEQAYTGETEGHNNLSVGFSRQNLGGDLYMPKSTSNREKQESLKISAAKCGEDRERKHQDIQVSSDEETMCIAGSDSYEVDRKAGEFIAKFRKQIRLQRTTSIETIPGGLNITDNCIT